MIPNDTPINTPVFCVIKSNDAYIMRTGKIESQFRLSFVEPNHLVSVKLFHNNVFWNFFTQGSEIFLTPKEAIISLNKKRKKQLETLENSLRFLKEKQIKIKNYYKSNTY